jgi:dihydropyrimidinase
LKQTIEAGSCVDFGLHFVLATKQHLKRIGHYVDSLGVPTLKVFMSSRGNEGARLGMPHLDDGFLFSALEEVARCGGMLCPHPESIEVSWLLRDRVLASDPEGRGGLASWNAVKPPFVEAESVRRVCYFAKQTNTPVYTVHISSEEPLRAAIAAQQEGGAIFIETCIHYLTLDLEIGADERAKVNPPIRERKDRDALWRAIAAGQIDTVGTDHIHRPLSAKSGGLWKASPGFPGMETFLPSLLTEGRRRGVSIERLSDLVSKNPARIMGLHPAKGTISVGADADLAVVDLNASWQLRQEDVASSAGYAVVDDQKFDSRVIHTFVRGRHVLRDMMVDPASMGTGRYIHRRLSGSNNDRGSK